MPFKLSPVTTVTSLLLLVWSNHAANLRGQANPGPSFLNQAAGALGANQALAAMGQRVSLQKRIVFAMQSLNQEMSSLATKNDQLQRLDADEQLSRLPNAQFPIAQNSRFQSTQGAPPIGAIPSFSMLHPVVPLNGAAFNTQASNAPNPAAYMSFNTFGAANIPLPQPHMTSFMGPHSLGFPLNQGDTIRGVGLPGPALYPPVVHALPSYPVKMTSGPYFDPRGYPSSILQVPQPTNNDKDGKKDNNQPQAPTSMTPYPMQPMLPVMQGNAPMLYPGGGYPLLNPPTVYAPHGALATPYVGMSPAFVGGYNALPVDSMGYPLPFPGSPSNIPAPKDGAKGSGAGSGSGK